MSEQIMPVSKEDPCEVKKKVLLVDDAQLFLQLEKTFFQRNRAVEVLTASNGREALEIIKKERPDLVFIDLYMPKMDGDECCRLVKSDADLAGIPVVIVTASAGTEEQLRCKAAGCDEIVSKPINRGDFLSIAMKFLQLPVRAEPRYPARIKVRFGENRENLLSDYTVNISAGGLYLATESRLPLYTELAVEFRLPGREVPICCRGRVAWVNQDERAKRDLPPGMGIQLLDITIDDVQSMRAYIAANALAAEW